MKKLLLLLSLLMSEASIAQDCDQDAIAWAPAINTFNHQYPGVSIEGARLAQKSHIGLSAGVAAAPIKYQAYYLRITDGKEERGMEDVMKINLNMWVEGLYKLKQVDYSYSLNYVLGTGFDNHNGPYIHTGLNMRFPSGYKAWFLQAVYRSDKVFWLRTGIYLP